MIQNKEGLFYNVDKEWLSVLYNDKRKQMLDNIICELESKTDVLCPLIEDIFACFRYTPRSHMHTIIIGQDPYYTTMVNEMGITVPVANGLAFSSYDTKIPASLQNIYKCLLAQKLIMSTPKTADLRAWAVQGILLLNTSLTTEIGTPLKHEKIWKDYIYAIIKHISDNTPTPLNFILWGKKAHNLESIINTNNNILKYIHPSPLAANSGDFSSCPHFKYISETRKVKWDPHKTIHIYTDGSASKTGTGWAFYIQNGYYDGNVYHSVTTGTMQRAEGLAIVHALQFIIDYKILEPITLVTDSMLYINIITTYMKYWAKQSPPFSKTSNGTPIANLDIVLKIYEQYNYILKYTTIELIHQKSHKPAPLDVKSIEYSYWLGNSIADKYAKLRVPITCIQLNDVSI